MKQLRVRSIGALSWVLVSTAFNACSGGSNSGSSSGGGGGQASLGGSGGATASGGRTNGGGGSDAGGAAAGQAAFGGNAAGGVTGAAGGGGEAPSGGTDGEAGAGAVSTSGGTVSTSGGAVSTSGGTLSTSGGTLSTSGGTLSTSGGTLSTSGGTLSTSGGAGGGASCDASVSYNPQPSTVYLVVDRSGSMFDCLSTTLMEPSCADQADTTWSVLKSAILPVVQARQAQVRFGFASFTGTNPNNGGTCPIIDRVAPALNNYTAITSTYNALAFPPNSTEGGTKFEGPTSTALDLVGAQLVADQSPGDKFILLLTDGQPDYCDDGDSLCSVDSVVASLQRLKKQGITTLVFGIQWQYYGSPLATLQAFANAGAGESTLVSVDGGSTVYDRCALSKGWTADRVAAQKPAARDTTLGEYATVAGPTKAFTPATDQTSLSNAIGGAVSGAKSCNVSLSSVYGKPTQLDSTKLNLVDIKLGGVSIAQNAASGWSLPNASEILLNGAACDSFRSTNAALSLNIGCAALTFK